MIRVNINQAKTHLSEYLAHLKGGEGLLLCKRNVPVAEVHAVPTPKKTPRPIGLAKNQIKLYPSFFEPLPDEFLAFFEGKGD